ncbi:MAG: nicotinate-nucleotide--dimethylbenzimidazole phosphoribosyltransferase [Pseudobacteriovorax sp.]|nr:nicotinate-nucleotide--dimethylbenzimidazole phosphoribosyltransferase [Pseudobacteriovorax sp.]
MTSIVRNFLKSFDIPKRDLTRYDESELSEGLEAEFQLPETFRNVARSLMLVQNTKKPMIINPCLYILAADHGIADQGYCLQPQVFSRNYLQKSAEGKSSVNTFTRQHRIDLKLVDLGLKQAISHPKVTPRRLADANGDFSINPALTADQLQRCLNIGRDLVKSRLRHASVLGLSLTGSGGEIASLMLLSRLADIPLEQLFSKGDMLRQPESQLKELVQVSNNIQKDKTNIEQELLQFAGFEMVAAIGFILQASLQKSLVVIDDSTALVMAWITSLLMPTVTPSILVAKSNRSPADSYIIEQLGISPLLGQDLNLASSRGCASALSYPLLQSTCLYINEVLVQHRQQVQNLQ